MPGHDLNWCFSTLGCPQDDLDAVAALARRHAITRVELRTVCGRMDLPAYFEELGFTPASLAAWFADHGLSVASLDASARLIGANDADREELLAFGAWADALTAPGIRIFDGGTFENPPDDDSLREAAKLLDWWEGEKRSRGWTVDLMIETHDALCAAGRCLALARVSEAPVHILWDSHHTWRKTEDDPLQTWETLRSIVRHIHIKDSVGRPSPNGFPFTYVNLGEGEFPLEALFARLRTDRFAGPVSLEWERQWHPYLAPLDQPLTRLPIDKR